MIGLGYRNKAVCVCEQSQKVNECACLVSIAVIMWETTAVFI